VNRKRLLELIGLLTEVSSGDYLRSLNFSELRKTNKPTSDNQKEFYSYLQSKAKDGPIFKSKTISTVENLPGELSKPEAKWAANVLEQEPDVEPEQFSTILAWNKATKPRLEVVKFKDALQAAHEWSKSATNEPASEQLGKFLTKDIIFRCSNGYSIVKITNMHDLDLEGNIMQNCLKASDKGREFWKGIQFGGTDIYSLRDSLNHPHASMEFNSKSSAAVQIYGKQNVAPAEKYRPYIQEFLIKGIKHQWNRISGPYLPVESLSTLATSPNRIEREAAAASPLASIEILTALANDNASSVRSSIALNPNAPPEILSILAKDKSSHSHLFVARNPNASIETLLDLIKDGDLTLRAYMAGGEHTPPEVLTVLAKDGHSIVRMFVAKNQNTPTKILSVLAADEEAVVSEPAKNTLKTKGNLQELLRRLFQ